MKSILIIIITLGIYLTIPSYGQQMDDPVLSKKFRIGAAGALEVLTGHNLNNGSPLSLFVDGEYILNERIGIGLEIGWLERSRLVLTSNPPINVRTDRTIILAKGRYYLNPGEKIQSYGGIGAGAAFFFMRDGEFINSTLVSRSDHQVSFAFKPEIGLRIYWLNLGFAYTIMGKYKTPIADYSSLEFSLGVNLYLGKQ